MKQLTCEMCNSTDLIKHEGVFICQNCGTKYSSEEARAMMFMDSSGINSNYKVESVIDGMIKSAMGLINLKKWNEASDIYNRVITMDSSDYRGWWGMFLVKTKNMSLIKNGNLVIDTSDATTAIQMAPDEDKTSLMSQLADYNAKQPTLHRLKLVNTPLWTGQYQMYELKIDNDESLIIKDINSTQFIKEGRHSLLFSAPPNMQTQVSFEINQDSEIQIVFHARPFNLSIELKSNNLYLNQSRL